MTSRPIISHKDTEIKEVPGQTALWEGSISGQRKKGITASECMITDQSSRSIIKWKVECS